jgi:tRNA threonylcarbamoyladenosine biosynthesis protein TsaB
MILLWDSANMEVAMTFVDAGHQEEVRWQANRELARDMLGVLRRECDARGVVMHELEGLGVFRGPGSYTGLRIGLTVLNTLARDAKIPIVGATGDDWRNACLERLDAGVDDALVLPEYGAEARTTKPRK